MSPWDIVTIASLVVVLACAIQWVIMLRSFRPLLWWAAWVAFIAAVRFLPSLFLRG